MTPCIEQLESRDCPSPLSHVPIATVPPLVQPPPAPIGFEPITWQDVEYNNVPLIGAGQWRSTPLAPVTQPYDTYVRGWVDQPNWVSYYTGTNAYLWWTDAYVYIPTSEWLQIQERLYGTAQNPTLQYNYVQQSDANLFAAQAAYWANAGPAAQQAASMQALEATDAAGMWQALAASQK